MQRATDVRESCLTKKEAATQVNFLRKVSLTLNPRDQQVSMCEVNTSWPIRFGLRGRGGAKGACTGEPKVRRGPCRRQPEGRASGCACFESPARELGRTASSVSESSSRMRP